MYMYMYVSASLSLPGLVLTPATTMLWPLTSIALLQLMPTASSMSPLTLAVPLWAPGQGADDLALTNPSSMPS